MNRQVFHLTQYFSTFGAVQIVILNTPVRVVHTPVILAHNTTIGEFLPSVLYTLISSTFCTQLL